MLFHQKVLICNLNMLKYVLQIQIKVLSRQGTVNCNFLGTMWQRHVSYSGYSHNLKIRNLLVFTPSTRTCRESWGRQLQNDIMCDALGFKGSVVGSGKVDNWSFRWNDVTPPGNRTPKRTCIRPLTSYRNEFPHVRGFPTRFQSIFRGFHAIYATLYFFQAQSTFTFL